MAANINAEQVEGSLRQISEHQIDVNGAHAVQVETSDDGTVLWVNVNGVCLVRICRIKNLELPRAKVPDVH